MDKVYLSTHNSVFNKSQSFNNQTELIVQDKTSRRNALDEYPSRQKDKVDISRETKQKTRTTEKNTANFSSFYLVYKFGPGLNKVSVSYEPNFQANFIDELS